MSGQIEMSAVPPIVAWSGLVLVGLAVLMTLLDWGDLSGFEPVPPPRRRGASVLAVVGALLILGGLVGSMVWG